VKVWDWLVSRVETVGERLRLIGAMRAMAAGGDDLLGSATDVAARLTAAEEGMTDGAVYVMATPEALVVADSVPHALALQPEPESVQETPLF